MLVLAALHRLLLLYIVSISASPDLYRPVHFSENGIVCVWLFTVLIIETTATMHYGEVDFSKDFHPRGVKFWQKLFELPKNRKSKKNWRRQEKNWEKMHKAGCLCLLRSRLMSKILSWYDFFCKANASKKHKNVFESEKM